VEDTKQITDQPQRHGHTEFNVLSVSLWLSAPCSLLSRSRAALCPEP
jgi:hypothetical protein